jgi:hypothetical protein
MATTKTELYNNGTLVATKTSAPFNTFDWTPASGEVGSASLTVKRYEDGVLVATSAAVGGTVDAAAAQATQAIRLEGGNAAKKTDVSGSVTEWYDTVNNYRLRPDGAQATPINQATGVNFQAAQVLRSENTPFNGYFSINNDFHIVLVFKQSAAGNCYLMNSEVSTSDRIGISLRDSTIRVGCYDGSVLFGEKSTAFTDTTSKHKLEWKYVGGVSTAYLDDVELTTTGEWMFLSSANYFKVGNGQSTGGFILYDLYSYTSEMSSSQRTTLMNEINTNHGV